MQTETINPLSPSYRAIGRGPSGTIFAASNIAEAIKALSDEGFAAYETADGILTYHADYNANDTCAARDDMDFYREIPHVFPIISGLVNMGDVTKFIGN